MKIPLYQQCECGHLGHQHNQDGVCARCECKRFHHPTLSHTAFASGRPHYRRNPVSPPTRDSGSR